MENIAVSCFKEMKFHQCRLTPQREALLLTLIEERNAHFTPYQLFKKAKKTCPELGLATVYRALGLFTKLSLVKEVQFEKGVTYYEFVGPRGKHQHYHLVCKKCGHVEEINDLLLQNFLSSVIKRTGFLITDYSCQFFGCCTKCREEEVKQM